MYNTDQFRKTFDRDVKTAFRNYEYYNKTYLKIRGYGKKYLQPLSEEYKSQLQEIQNLIKPAVARYCPQCKNSCCQLHSPERSIYTAGTLGGFQFVDYILVRYDRELPDLKLGNLDKNLCAFWDHGCILPGDCRSYLCTQYFCDELKNDLDMKIISRHLDLLKTTMNDLSVSRCLGF